MTIKLNKYADDFLFVPLGGADEIGLNLYLYHYKGKWIVVDLGIGFADEYFPGVDIIVPDITFIQQIQKDIVGIVLTHAHEDHLGAMQYIWEFIQAPVYATKFTVAVLKAKIAESGFAKKIKVNEIKENSKFQVGPFDLEFIGLTHSVPEMQSILIRTDKGNIFHTGDWKIDDNPVVGNPSNLERLKQIGDEGVLAMICDSTNIFNDEASGSEGDLRQSLHDLIQGYKNSMVVVTTFASNIARVYSIAKVAEQLGRKVALAGTSLWRMTDAARQCGYLSDCPEFIKPRDINRYKSEEIIVIATGCQGERFAAINKLSKNEHPDFRLSPNDVVIFASRIIPGNEMKIFTMFNRFCKSKIEVVTEKDHFVHVSGHPGKPEVARMYELIRPQMAIPVHGEPMHIHEHCAFAKKLEIKQTLQTENGFVIKIEESGPKIVEKVPVGQYAIDGNFIISSDSDILRNRRRMRDDGIVFVSVVLSSKGKLLKQPVVEAPGVLDYNEDHRYFDNLTEDLRELVIGNNRASDNELEKKVRTLVKRFIKSEVGKEPKIIIHIHKVAV